MKQKGLGKRIAAWLMCLALVLTTINLPAFTTTVKADETVTWDAVKDTIKGAYGRYGSFLIVSDDKITVPESEYGDYTFNVADIKSISKSVNDYGKDIIVISYNMNGEHTLQFKIYNGNVIEVYIDKDKDSEFCYNPAMEVSIHLNDETETVKTEYVSRYEGWNFDWLDKYIYTLPSCDFYVQPGKECVGWSYTPNGEVIEESAIEVKEKTDLYAQWKDAYFDSAILKLPVSGNQCEENGIRLEGQSNREIKNDPGYAYIVLDRDHPIRITQTDYKNIEKVILDCHSDYGNARYKVSRGEISGDIGAISTISNVNAATLTIELEDDSPDANIDFARIKVIYDYNKVPKVQISFDANGGLGTQETENVDCGDYTLPTTTTFEAPNNKKFVGWSTSAWGTPITDETISVLADITLYAIWENKYEYEKKITLTADIEPRMSKELIKNSISQLSGVPISVKSVVISDFWNNEIQEIPENDFYDIKMYLEVEDKEFVRKYPEYTSEVVLNEKLCDIVIDSDHPGFLNIEIYNYSQVRIIGNAVMCYRDGRFCRELYKDDVFLVNDLLKWVSYDIPVLYMDGKEIKDPYNKIERNIRTRITKIYYDKLCLCTNPNHMKEKGVDGFCDTCRTVVVSGAPIKKEKLEYTGKNIELVDASQTKVFGGIMVYRLGEVGEFTTSIPQAKNVGNYTVYYKVKGNSGYTDTEPVSIDVTIEKAEYPYEIPTNIVVKCGQKLSDITLPAGFHFTSADGVLIADEDKPIDVIEKKAKYVPEDTTNYVESTDIPIRITVEHEYKSVSATEHKCQVDGCTSKKAHDFSVFVDDTKHKCSLCGVEEEHTLSGWKQAADGHYKICSVCKKDTIHIAHAFSDTFTPDKHTCDVCGAEENHRFGADGKADQCEACIAKNINAASLDDKVVSEDTFYTGEDIATDVVITGLTKDVDYTVTNLTKKEVGEYTVTITGKGQYAGTREVKWSIGECTHPIDKVVVEHKTLPTCETKGEDVKRCTVCNKVVEEGTIVEPLGHDYVDGICSRCGVVSFELNINKDILINGVNVVFDGQEHTAEVVVTYKGVILTKDVDYTATSVTAKKVGSYDVTVTGIGKYRGEVTAKWSVIHPEGMWCEDIADQMYTGSIIKPTVEVYADGMLLQSGVDYTIAYGKNNTNVADKEAKNKNGASIAPSVTITGKGNYAGKITKTFSIVACDLGAGEVTASVDDMTVAYNHGNNIKINPVVTYNNKPLKAGKDYVVSKTADAKSKDDVVTVLKDAETHNLYIVGQGNYSGAVPFKVVITKAVPASKVVVAKIPDQKYADGNAVTPNDLIKITYKNKDVKDQFDISYQNNTEVGTATVILTAKEGTDKDSTAFVGTKKVTFKIVGEQVKSIKLGSDGKGKIASYVYTGNACEPGEEQGLVLYAGSTKLTKDVDYTVTYEKNINVGTANAVITGKGKYTGTKKFAYKITPYDASKDEAKQLKITEILDGANHSVAVTDETNIIVAFEKGATTPKPVVTFAGKTLEEKKDYTVAYANNKAVADKAATKAPTMNITFKGNYTGKKAVVFTITKKNIAETTLAVGDLTVSTKANGWKQTKAMITDTNGKKLAAGADYDKNFKYYQDKDCTVEITEEVITAMGGANGTLPAGAVVYVKVTGLNSYADSVITGSYRIAKQSIAGAKATIATQTFTGKPICPKAEEITVTIGSGKNAKTLTAGTDYEVVAGSYKNNINKGNATVTIRGLGDYCGTKDVKFVITNKSFRWWK